MSKSNKVSNLYTLLDCHKWSKTLSLVAFFTALTFILGLHHNWQSSQQQLIQLQVASASQSANNERLALQNQALIAENKQQATLLAARDEQLSEQHSEIEHLTTRLDGIEIVLGVEQETLESDTISERVDTAAIHFATRSAMQRMIPSGKPMKTYRRTSGFGSRTHPVTGKVRQHLGLDLATDIGTPIYAPADGVVEMSRTSNKGYGNMVKVQHAYGFMTIYAHLDSYLVQKGEFVRKGQLIAYSGNSGLSTGPHLHYEVRFLGRALNPKLFMNWQADTFESLFEREKTIAWGNMVDVIADSMALPVQLTQDPAGTPSLAVNAPLVVEEGDNDG